MSAKKFIEPPENVQQELIDLLKSRYPDLEAKLNGYFTRNISYDSGERPIRYEATVTYFFEKSTPTAIFSYKENMSNRTYFWYCRHDWND